MKKIKSIYMIFVFFFIMIIVSFLLLYHYSAVSLQSSLMRVARIQMDYAENLLEQKSNEIEIEADGRRQKSNVGMAEFILYWPESGDIITTLNRTEVDSSLPERAADNRWISSGRDIYFVKRYSADWLIGEE